MVCFVETDQNDENAELNAKLDAILEQLANQQ